MSHNFPQRNSGDLLIEPVFISSGVSGGYSGYNELMIITGGSHLSYA